jgi:hypothetical protein
MGKGNALAVSWPKQRAKHDKSFKPRSVKAQIWTESKEGVDATVENLKTSLQIRVKR